jgi:hypothetical protein
MDYLLNQAGWRTVVFKQSLDGGRFDLIQVRHLAITAALILTLGYLLYLTASDKISQADTTEKIVYLQAEVAPQVVGQAGIASMAIAKTLATRCVDRLVHGINYLSHLNALHLARQLIAATRATHTGNQAAAAQFGKQLLKVGKRNALALGNIGQGHGPVLCVQRQIEHRSYGVTAFCSQSHGQVPRNSEWGEYAIPDYLSQLLDLVL